jgi:ankyrin repeat protein
MSTAHTCDDVLRAVVADSTEFFSYGDQPPGVNDRGAFGNVPLIPVITWGDWNSVESLLRAGADVNAVCERGNTPLHHAIGMGEFAIARLLLAHGADPTVRNQEGKLAKDLCWEAEWPGIFGAGDA